MKTVLSILLLAASAFAQTAEYKAWEQAKAALINGSVAQGTSGSVWGEDAPGEAPTKKPIWVAGSDGSLIRSLTTDSNGYLKVLFQNESLAVTGTFWQAIQPVSGSVSVSNFPASQAVTGVFWQSVQPVSGTFWQSTQPVSVASMPSTPVTGTFWQATQPVSGTFFQAVQPVSLGNATGKTSVMVTASKVTTATTADQVILTYTVTAGKTFYLQYLDIDARLTTFATTATYFGLASLESPSGTKLISQMKAGAGITVDPHYEFPEPVPVAAGTAIRVVTTPSAVTSYTWQASFGGYEK